MMRSAFWDDHVAALANPEYARAYAAEERRQRLLAWVQTVTVWACTWALERAGVR